jgi:hypothetical protein
MYFQLVVAYQLTIWGEWLDARPCHSLRGAATRALVNIASEQDFTMPPTCLSVQDPIVLEAGHVCSGGFGNVHRGTSAQQTVAVKIPRLLSNELDNVSPKPAVRKVCERIRLPCLILIFWCMQQFWREVFTWRQLNHWHVLKLLGLYIPDPSSPALPGMVSPWMANGTAVHYLSEFSFPTIWIQQRIVSLELAITYTNF